MTPLIFDFSDNADLFGGIASQLQAERGRLHLRDFPDGETYVRVDSACAQREAIIVCGLDRPNPKLLPLLLVAATLRDLGATRVGLVAPYLAYMRQDKRFVDGEGVTARYFAALLSASFDWLVTVDPHLHRIQTLDQIYTLPTCVARSAPLLARWIKREITRPLLIGPDAESEQWVCDVARRAGVPYRILEKTRTGDRDVSVSVPDVAQHVDRVPILIDDIASTGQTFVAALGVVRQLGMVGPVCIAVHGVFAHGAISAMREAGALRIVTCNTIAHETNAIDLSKTVASACRSLVAATSN